MSNFSAIALALLLASTAAEAAGNNSTVPLDADAASAAALGWQFAANCTETIAGDRASVDLSVFGDCLGRSRAIIAAGAKIKGAAETHDAMQAGYDLAVWRLADALAAGRNAAARRDLLRNIAAGSFAELRALQRTRRWPLAALCAAVGADCAALAARYQAYAAAKDGRLI